MHLLSTHGSVQLQRQPFAVFSSTAASYANRARDLIGARQVGSAEAWSFKNTALAVQTYILSCTAHGLDTAPMEGFDARR